MNWTPIDVELPPAFIPILFVSVSRDGKTNVCYGQYENQFFVATEIYGRRIVYPQRNITHWMNIPEVE